MWCLEMCYEFNCTKLLFFNDKHNAEQYVRGVLIECHIEYFEQHEGIDHDHDNDYPFEHDDIDDLLDDANRKQLEDCGCIEDYNIYEITFEDEPDGVNIKRAI